MIASVAILALVTLQRLGELWLARRNTAALTRSGAIEYGASHYPFIVLLHAAWLAGLWILAWNRPVRIGWLIVFVLLQLARLWVLATLEHRWTTRIIVLPGAPLVAAGPYRFLPHPNYTIVATEIAVLPFVFGLSSYALVFSILNAALLFVRIRAEDGALRR